MIHWLKMALYRNILRPLIVRDYYLCIMGKRTRRAVYWAEALAQKLGCIMYLDEYLKFMDEAHLKAGNPVIGRQMHSAHIYLDYGLTLECGYWEYMSPGPDGNTGWFQIPHMKEVWRERMAARNFIRGLDSDQLSAFIAGGCRR